MSFIVNVPRVLCANVATAMYQVDCLCSFLHLTPQRLGELLRKSTNLITAHPEKVKFRFQQVSASPYVTEQLLCMPCIFSHSNLIFCSSSIVTGRATRRFRPWISKRAQHLHWQSSAGLEL